MPDRPLLLLAQPSRADRDRGRAAIRPPVSYPSTARQGERLAAKLEALQRALDARRLRLQMAASGADIEQVVVFETVGSVERFLKAVEKIPGLEWLAEFAEDDVEPDQDFKYAAAADASKPLQGTMYLVMENQQGMQQLLGLWASYQRFPDSKFARGLAPIKNLFKQLRDVRRWDAIDRVRETGIEENWKEQVRYARDGVRFEADLWYRDSFDFRQRTAASFADAIAKAGGQILSQSVIPDIRYHGMLVQLPSAPVEEVLGHFDELLQLPETHFIRANEVMFFRPVPQFAAPINSEAPPEESAVARAIPPRAGAPIVALLDGLPLTNHVRLANQLIVDDPDGWEQSYLAKYRQHGTAMASLILHGDLNEAGNSLSVPVYVRPVLRPVERNGRWQEEMPDDSLPIDLTYRAIRRMFDSEGEQQPQAPTVKIINFSIGDANRPFLHELSPWARLFDWAASHYKVLFTVSCGNYARFEIPTSRQNFEAMTVPERTKVLFEYASRNARHRRLLSPAESVNSLCVGATHEDGCGEYSPGYQLDACCSGFPSPLNALGAGYNRAIKPDLLLPGGRQLFNGLPRSGELVLETTPLISAPGQKVAMPGLSGETNREGYVRGSSNATALASRAAAQLHEMMSSLRLHTSPSVLPDRITAVLLKSLLVHGCKWPEDWRQLEHLLEDDRTDRDIRSLLTRFGGYGRFDLMRVLECTAQRATLLGGGTLAPEQGHIYRVPLPPCLNASVEYRQVIITLAWITPVNHRHRKYRSAVLWFDPPQDPLHVSRSAADWNAVRRGTVQHEVLDGNRAVAITDGDTLTIKVNCREDAGGHSDIAVDYGIVITLETPVGSRLPIYDEVRARIQPAIQVTPALRT